MVHGTPPSWSISGRRREIPLPGINFLPYFGNLWETLEFQTWVVSYRNSLLEKVRDIFSLPRVLSDLSSHIWHSIIQGRDILEIWALRDVLLIPGGAEIP